MSSLGDSDDLDALRRAAAALESELAAHRVEVRETVADALARSAEREQAVAAALDSLTSQLNQFTATLAAEVRRAGDATVAQAVAELGNAARAVEGARVDAVAEAVARVDARVAQLATTVGPSLRELATARIDEGLVEEVRRLRVSVEGLAGQAGAEPATDQAAVVEALRDQIGEVAGELRRSHDALGDELVEIGSGIRSAVRRDVEGIGEQLRGLAGALEGLVAASSERANLPAALERALNALDALDMLALRPDPTPAIERLAAALGDSTSTREPGGQASGAGLTRDDLRAELDALQHALLDAPAPASPDDLERLHAEVAAIAEAVAALRPTADRVVDPGLGELRAELAAWLDREQTALAALQDSVRALAAPPPAATVDLEPLRQAVEALGDRPVATADDVAGLRAALDRLAERLPAAIEPPAALGDVQAGLATIAERLDGLASTSPTLTTADLADLRAAIAVDLEVVAQRLDAIAAAARPADLDDPVRRLAERLDDGAAPVTGAAPPVDLQPVLDAITRLADRPLPATAAELADLRAAIDAVADRTSAAAAPPAPPVDLQPVLDAITRLADRPLPATAAELADLRAAIDAVADRTSAAAAPPARPVDLQPVLDAVTRLADRPLPATAAELADLRAAIDAVGSVAEVEGVLDQLRNAVAGLAERPAPAAVDLAPVVHAVEDLGRRVDALAAPAPAPDLADLHQRVDGLAASVAELAAGVARLGSVPASGPEEPHVDALARQLDAIGRLVHHAVRSLHLVEAATVGAGPRTERDRAAAAAALDELRAARGKVEPTG